MPSLCEYKEIPAEFRSLVEVLLLVVKLLVKRVNLNSSNSSKSPSTDPNRKRGSKRKGKGKKRKPGGQLGHNGTHLKPVADPDHIETIEVARGHGSDGNLAALQRHFGA